MNVFQRPSAANITLYLTLTVLGAIILLAAAVY